LPDGSLHLVDDLREPYEDLRRVTLQQRDGGGSLDCVASEVDVGHIFDPRLHHDHAAVRLGAQQPFLNQSLHCLAKRPTTHRRALRELHSAGCLP
jgi:hypothetical protein